MKETIEKINEYMAKNYRPCIDEKKKDFFNLMDGSMTCGRCGKKLKGFKMLIHFHI